MHEVETALQSCGQYSLIYYPDLNAFSILSFNAPNNNNEFFVGCDRTAYLNDLKNWCIL